MKFIYVYINKYLKEMEGTDKMNEKQNLIKTSIEQYGDLETARTHSRGQDKVLLNMILSDKKI